MIKFDPAKVTFKKIKLKTINALSGSIQVIDETVRGKEKTYKMECHNSITRLFKKTYNITFFTVPYECAIMLYDGHIVALEKAVINERFTEGLNGIIEWVPQMERVYSTVQSLMNAQYDWYFDGSYVYSFGCSLEDAITGGKFLSRSGNFRSLVAQAIHINYIGISSDVYVESRNCLAYVANNDVFSITPPIWKTLEGIGSNKIKSEDTIGLTTQFDKVDNNLMVNLQFAIVAGTALTRQFGYQSIEPLQLPKLMVQLKTVNLPQISTEIKQTFDIGLSFTQAMAWLLGINRNITTYEEMITMKKLFRYLSTNGIFSKQELSNILKSDEEIPLLDIASFKLAA
jgi:hypothetical protein